MRLVSKIFKDNPSKNIDKGILVFENTSEVIYAEEMLKKRKIAVKVKAPPPAIQKGCDLVIEFPIIKQLEIIEILKKEDLEPLEVLYVKDELLEPVSLFKKKDLGDFIMIRAANMKITISKKDLKIVNISGGGCPDVPYLASIMIGKKLNKAPLPKKIGHTLCAYALQLAYEEAMRLCF